MATRVTRTSQRPSKSCIECRTRKVRCDKRVPCARCVSNGLENTCAQEVVQLSTRQTKSREEIQFLQVLLQNICSADVTAVAEAATLLRRRLHLLETGRELDDDDKHRLLPAAESIQQRHQENQDAVAGSNDGDEAAETAAALMRLGRGYPTGSDLKEAAPRRKGPQSDLKGTHIDEQQARLLIDYYITMLSWHHHVIHAPTFIQECETYWTSDNPVDDLWLALYLSVLTAAIWNLPTEKCQAIFSRDDLHDQAEIWYSNMLDILEAGDFMNNHSIYTLQAVLISCMVVHPLGLGTRHMVLLSSCLRIAQCLGLGEQPRPALDFEQQRDNEIGARVWWQLIIQDYFLVPLAGAYSVHPNHFTTSLPLNCDDGDLLEQSPEVPKKSSYCLTLAKLSLLMPPLIDSLRSLGKSSPELRYQHVQAMDKKMRSLMSGLPPFLRPDTPDDPRWEPWVLWARSAMTISAADKIIMIHRSFFIKSLHERTKYSFTRETCVSAASTILHELQRIRDTDIVRLWIIPAFAVSAAIVIYLNLVSRQSSGLPQDQAALDLLHDTIAVLKALRYDHNARRGVEILEPLVAQKLGHAVPWHDESEAALFDDDLLRLFLVENSFLD